MVRKLARDPVIATLAALPDRAEYLSRVVDSLLPQVDAVVVWLNGWSAEDRSRWIPRLPAKVRIEHGRKVDGVTPNVGDAGKFVSLPEFVGYRLTCDDDLEYGPDYVGHMVKGVERYGLSDYVEHMIAGVERYGRKAVVSLHGRRFTAFPVESYYRGTRESFHCLAEQLQYEPVHCPGTGVMCYHTDTISFSEDDFPLPNMADLHVGLKCEKLGIPRIALAHPKGMITHLPIDLTTTIHAQLRNRDEAQTRLVNSIEWTSLTEVV